MTALIITGIVLWVVLGSVLILGLCRAAGKPMPNGDSVTIRTYVRG